MFTSLYGRWLSPDALAGDITNPQSLNRYAYVMNNPVTFTDPLGLKRPICGNIGCTGGTTANALGIGYAIYQFISAGGYFSPIGPLGSGDDQGAEANAQAYAAYQTNLQLVGTGLQVLSDGTVQQWVPPSLTQSAGMISLAIGGWQTTGQADLSYTDSGTGFSEGYYGPTPDWLVTNLGPAITQPFSDLAAKISHNCVAQFAGNSVKNFATAASWATDKVPSYIKNGIAASQVAGYYFGATSYYVPQLGTWATGAYAVGEGLSTIGAYAAAYSGPALGFVAAGSGVYALYQEYQSALRGGCE